MPQYSFRFRRMDGSYTPDRSGKPATVTFTAANRAAADERIRSFVRGDERAELVTGADAR